jgi:hypothetical protein
MICTTVREGSDCLFMTAKGCSYKGGACLPIIEKCNGCERVITHNTGLYCKATPDPAAKWKNGNCNLATHIVAEAAQAKTKVNPLKASKRSKR